MDFFLVMWSNFAPNLSSDVPLWEILHLGMICDCFGVLDVGYVSNLYWHLASGRRHLMVINGYCGGQEMVAWGPQLGEIRQNLKWNEKSPRWVILVRTVKKCPFDCVFVCLFLTFSRVWIKRMRVWVWFSQNIIAIKMGPFWWTTPVYFLRTDIVFFCIKAAHFFTLRRHFGTIKILCLSYMLQFSTFAYIPTKDFCWLNVPWGILFNTMQLLCAKASSFPRGA